MTTKHPALEQGLRQIPDEYLRTNLLPMLENENSPLLFNGYIVQNCTQTM